MGNVSSKKKKKGPPSKYQPSVAFPGDDNIGRDEAKLYQQTEKDPRKAFLKKRINCFLDITIDGEAVGRLVCELRPDIQPRTVENFRALCTGELGYGYKGCKWHKIIPNFVVQTGDVVNKGKPNEGQGGRSIYGPSFADEDLSKLRHEFGSIAMASSGGPHSSHSQFMIVVDEEGCDFLDGKHVVFGKLSEKSLDVLRKIEACAESFERDGKQRARITKECVIADAGML